MCVHLERRSFGRLFFFSCCYRELSTKRKSLYELRIAGTTIARHSQQLDPSNGEQTAIWTNRIKMVFFIQNCRERDRNRYRICLNVYLWYVGNDDSAGGRHGPRR